MTAYVRRWVLGAAMMAALTLRVSAQVPATQSPAFALDDVIPFDAAVTTGTLPNGLRYYIRHNERPAHRVFLRLAVKAGSLDEADDQQGLAHMVEHMAFNGSAHFKPGELISYFESVGAKLGPHVNAYTSFEETVYMLDLPSDQPRVVTRGLEALADFGGGLTLDPGEIDKERGVVLEEWRGGLGAGSRIRDKEIPLLYYKSRYAERLPIGKPDILKTFKPERLRAFYDTFYRPDRMAVVAVGDIDVKTLEAAIAQNCGTLKARTPSAPARVAEVPIPQTLLVGVVTDPEATRSSIAIVRKRPRESEQHVADYRRDLVERFFEQMLNDRFDELARKPDATFLQAGASGGALSPDVATFSLSAAVADGHLSDGLTTLAIEAARVRQFGFAASELARAKKWMAAFYDRAYRERDKTESESYAQEYLNHFLEQEPSPGIDYEYRLVQQLLPGVTGDDVSSLARHLLEAQSRVVLAVAPEKAGLTPPTEAGLRTTLEAASKVAVTPWADTVATRALMPEKPAAAAVTARRELPALGVSVVRFANGVEAWLKPTDFKNDQVLFALSGKGGASLAPPEDYPEASLATALVGLSGAGGLSAVDLDKVVAGQLVSASPYIALSTDGLSGSSTPADLETALQLMYQKVTAPNDDPNAFALLKRQLAAALVNREKSPQAVFAEKVAAVDSSNHYTSRPLSVERVERLDRAKMLSFYRQRFSNAADFTFFMVGAFKVDDVVPMIARYVGSLPSAGHATSTFKDVGIHFPSTTEQAVVEKGTEPRSQTVISFFADPPIDAVEQERVSAATDVLETALRDMLREELGQTYTVSVGLSQALPQRGAGHIVVSFGSAPENAESMTTRVLDEIAKLQKDGPSEDLVNRAREAALRGYETALKQNGYWLGRLQSSHMFDQDPALILTRRDRINAVTPASVGEMFRKYFPLQRHTVVTLVPQKPAGP